MNLIRCLFLLFLTSIFTQAYIGPGLAGSTLAAIFGVIGSFFLALFAILYYPIKRALKNRKKKNQS